MRGIASGIGLKDVTAYGLIGGFHIGRLLKILRSQQHCVFINIKNVIAIIIHG